MAYTGIITKLAALASIGLASASGVQTVVKITTPPAIEGTGVYGAPVAAGDIVAIKWTITKRTKCEGVVSRVWSGEDGFYLVEAQHQSALPTNPAPVVYHVQTEIPELAPAGKLNLSVKGVYSCKGGDIGFELGPVVLEIVE